MPNKEKDRQLRIWINPHYYRALVTEAYIKSIELDKAVHIKDVIREILQDKYGPVPYDVVADNAEVRKDANKERPPKLRHG